MQEARWLPGDAPASRTRNSVASVDSSSGRENQAVRQAEPNIVAGTAKRDPTIAGLLLSSRPTGSARTQRARTLAACSPFWPS